jgi:hypothetical protein
MNQPQNPVIKPGTLSLPPKQVSLTPKQPPAKTAEPQATREMARLSMPESHALIQWLLSYKMQPGDTYNTLALAAASALGNVRINKNHIQQRCEEFSIELPRRPSNLPVIERLNKLEAVLATAIREQIKVCRDMGVEVHPDLVAFAE